MPATVDPNAIIVGAAEVYWRAVGGTGPWTSAGATVDDVVWRVVQSYFNASDDINGILAPIYLMDYKSKEHAEAEFTLLELAGAKLAIPVTGATSTTRTTGTVGGGGSSTLAAAAAAGATSITLAAGTGFAVGDYVKIDVSTLIEYRRLTAVAGAVLSFRDPLLLAHASGVAALEVDGDGKTVIVPGVNRRLPSTAYNDFALVAQSPTAYYELMLFNAVSTTESAEVTMGNETKAGIRVTVASRQLGSDLAAPNWSIYVP